jgi:hypothetical protein
MAACFLSSLILSLPPSFTLTYPFLLRRPEFSLLPQVLHRPLVAFAYLSRLCPSTLASRTVSARGSQPGHAAHEGGGKSSNASFTIRLRTPLSSTSTYYYVLLLEPSRRVAGTVLEAYV